MPVEAASGDAPAILYLIGTARCGSTALAAVLAGHTEIRWRGELIHLVNSVPGGSLCSCGRELVECDVWRRLKIHDQLRAQMEYCHRYESHWSALTTMLFPKRIPIAYEDAQIAMLKVLAAPGETLLDSSKYVGRGLALSTCSAINTHFIYMVRDPRGVVFSFSKNVQTRRNTISACMYYMAVNIVAEIATRWTLRGRVVKLRYEDLLNDPETTIRKIGELTGMSMDAVVEHLHSDAALQADHVAGGNRWVLSGSSQLRHDRAWQDEMGFARRLLIHLLCFPLQLVNRYRL